MSENLGLTEHSAGPFVFLGAGLVGGTGAIATLLLAARPDPISSSGRTADSGSVNRGSSPRVGTGGER